MRRMLVAFTLLAVVGMLAAGCGGGGSLWRERTDLHRRRPGRRERGDHRQPRLLAGDAEPQDGPAGDLDQQAGHRAHRDRRRGRLRPPDAARGAFSFLFDKAGSFPYHCTIHPSMTATIQVS